MADSYLDLVLKAGKYDIRDERLNLIKVQKHYTREELQERERAKKELDSIFRATELRGC